MIGITMESIETKQRFIELRAAGKSYDKIAIELGKSKQTLIDWGREFDSEITNLKNINLEALYEAYNIFKEIRLKQLANLLSKASEAINDRDFTDVPTDKLIDLVIKLNNQIDKEITPPLFQSTEELTEDIFAKLSIEPKTYTPLLIDKVEK